VTRAWSAGPLQKGRMCRPICKEPSRNAVGEGHIANSSAPNCGRLRSAHRCQVLSFRQPSMTMAERPPMVLARQVNPKSTVSPKDRNLKPDTKLGRAMVLATDGPTESNRHFALQRGATTQQALDMSAQRARGVAAGLRRAIVRPMLRRGVADAYINVISAGRKQNASPWRQGIASAFFRPVSSKTNGQAVTFLPQNSIRGDIR
jgi:hypothetical protein